MRKTLLLTVLSALSFSSFAQNDYVPKANIKWAPTGLIVGSFSLQGEYALGKHSSLTAKIGIPSGANYTVDFDGDDTDFKMKATSFMAGYRLYISQKSMKGLYFEPFVKYVNHIAEGTGRSTLGIRNVSMDFTNDYDAFGIGAQLGAQFRIGNRFVIDLFLIGPEINSAKNSFKATEMGNTIPWTQIEASEAERDVKDFIDDVPFIRNKTKVNVDRDNKTVTADFKGALPGFRTGISFGIAF
jgi:hypothetical protein